MKVKFKTCGMVLKTVNTYKILGNGDLTIPSRRPLNYFYFQWSFVTPSDPNYGVFDLLTDMSQEIYLLHLTGSPVGSNAIWTKYLWVSPFGYSNVPIPKAPRREIRDNPKYSSEDLQHVRFWMKTYHHWTASHFWNKFGTLARKLDVSIDMPVNVAIANCKQADVSHVYTESLKGKEVYYG